MPGDVTLTLSHSELWVLKELLNDAIDADRTTMESHQPLLHYIEEKLDRVIASGLGSQEEPLCPAT